MASIHPERFRSQRPEVVEVPCQATRAGSNPFSTRFTRPGALTYRFDEAAPNPVADARAIDGLLVALVERRHGLIVGPHGTGKSTLLHTLMPRLAERFSVVAMVRLNGCRSSRLVHRWRHVRQVGREMDREIRSLSAVANSKPPGLLVIDGAEQISLWQRNALLRWSRRGGHAVLATSHRPLLGMDVLYRTRLDAKLIHGLTMRLLGGASAEITAVVHQALASRDLDRESNLRELWFDLYDVVQPRLVRAEISEASNKQHGCATVRPDDSIQSAHGRCAADG